MICRHKCNKLLMTVFLPVVMLLFPLSASAQFNDTYGTGSGSDMFGQQDQTYVNNGENDTAYVQSRPSFTFKQYFRALGHRDTMPIAYMWAGSAILPGTAQIYNKDYWKLPIVYGGIGACLGSAYWSNLQFLKTGRKHFETQRNLLYAGAVLVWWGSMLDGVISYKSLQRPLPPRASLYSALLPGLGQIYNGDYWKLPIFYGGLMTCAYLWNFNGKQYTRYKNMYLQAMDPDSGYEGIMTAEDLKWRRDVYRRYRDYSIIATVLVYVLNIVDANVFAYMHDFDTTDDLSFRFEPAIIEPVNYERTGFFAPASQMQYAVGMKLNITF